ncbi:MAG: 50S ribosomal protein L11 methyltransferase [Ignavibacteria bacterium]|nr:50S ribosomal protein L11 methyltransferase [Ignavibacteria bacterium]MCU7504109.1 50S ribosomal protein L11 methyltransferase [Ignavibacteria bacterium]MCU7516441.1 50S ribosomal protein L11 methyltransferase [Ignavibacteria bacterium]
MKHFKEFVINTEPELYELVSGVLWKLDITGVTVEEPYVKAFSESGKVKKSEIETLLESLVQEKLIESYAVDENEFEERNWNEEWEKSLNIIEVSDKIVIRPSTKEYKAREGQLVLTIDPKMSFGTGEHATTRLMLLMVEKYVKEGMNVLDVGTGTGVLAIAAVRLGASHAVAIDNDEWCYDNGIENCQVNSVGSKVDIRLGEISQVEDKNFDLVLANINKNILMDISQELTAHVKPGGTLILSGLLFSDEEDITGRYGKEGFIVTDKKQIDEWISLVMKRK